MLKKIMMILESSQFLRVAIDPVCQRRSERLGTLNAACEKFRFSEVQRRGHVLERTRGAYECHNSRLEVPHALNTGAF